jgi:hypothetical protein
MGTYETIPDLEKALDEVSLPTKKKKKTKPKTGMSAKHILMAYSLFQDVANGITFFGKIREEKAGKATAEFICSCGTPFRSELKPILSGKIKTCGCNTK